jgi:two-component system response regulator AlgR
VSIKAIVVDDEPLARARLRRLLTSQGVDVVAEGENGQQAVNLVEQQHVDMLFLDINMPIMTGLEAAVQIGALDKQAPAIVFCTAYDEFAIQAFRTNAAAYLLKPIQVADISAAIVKATSLSQLQLSQMLEQQQGSKTIAVNYRGALQNMDLSKFAYFSSIDKNVFAVLNDGEQILIDKTLKYLESQHADDLLRVHRSTLINRHCAERLLRDASGHTSVILKNFETPLAVSRRHLSEVKKCFQ